MKFVEHMEISLLFPKVNSNDQICFHKSNNFGTKKWTFYKLGLLTNIYLQGPSTIQEPLVSNENDTRQLPLGNNLIENNQKLKPVNILEQDVIKDQRNHRRLRGLADIPSEDKDSNQAVSEASKHAKDQVGLCVSDYVRDTRKLAPGYNLG